MMGGKEGGQQIGEKEEGDSSGMMGKEDGGQLVDDWREWVEDLPGFEG